MTDSLGSKSSERSGVGSVINAAASGVALHNRVAIMDVACVLDLQHTDRLSHRRRAYEEVKAACLSLGANFHHVQVKDLLLFCILINIIRCALYSIHYILLFIWYDPYSIYLILINMYIYIYHMPN